MEIQELYDLHIKYNWRKGSGKFIIAIRYECQRAKSKLSISRTQKTGTIMKRNEWSFGKENGHIINKRPEDWSDETYDLYMYCTCTQDTHYIHSCQLSSVLIPFAHAK